MIVLKNIERCFRSKGNMYYALRQINIEIDAGEFVTIMGPSGAGKSTLLSILGMYDNEWEGEYLLDGQNVHQLRARERAALNKRLIGFVFQQYHLLNELTVAENLALPLTYRDINRSQREALVADALDRFGIVGKKDLFPSQLSGGQQQLVGVARAVIARPAVLLADEPTGNLHSAQAQEIMQMFTRLNREGTAIIQVTHSEANAAYGRRTIQLKDGWIVDQPVPA